MNTSNYVKSGVTFKSGELTLEGTLFLPAEPAISAAVIVCHPHPQYGGSMDNNVVNRVCDSLVKASIAAFKFNFRGVGKSEGEFDNGLGEQWDVKAAVDYLSSRREIDLDRIGLAGYSAGSTWGLLAGYTDPRIHLLSAISPPVEIFDFDFLKQCQKPVFLISGSRDPLGPPEKVHQFCDACPRFLTCETVPGADHTWFGYEPILADRITAFFTTNFHLGENPNL